MKKTYTVPCTEIIETGLKHHVALITASGIAEGEQLVHEEIDFEDETTTKDIWSDQW